MLIISLYEDSDYTAVISFLTRAFKQDARPFSIHGKERDLADIRANYMREGCFWCLKDDNSNIYGTIALCKLSDCWEIRRMFIERKFQKKGYGKLLLEAALRYAVLHNINIIKAATLERGKAAQAIFTKAGFLPTSRYNNSSADVFFKLEITLEYRYNFLLKRLANQFSNTLILNPTENLPTRNPSIETNFFDGLYVSEYPRSKNDKIIFAGRNDYIEFFDVIKREWAAALGAFEVDLKTLSGLHAHTILFMCLLQAGDTVMLLPEVCGGHFSTETILKNLGAKVIHMQPDFNCMKVDRVETEKLICEHKPRYIFVDRSEGLIYEDFSWLSRFDKSCKIFDASQYLSQILVEKYENPFDMGFDIVISTLHKNFPGPQKGLICTAKNSIEWKMYQDNAKTYISNTHPGHIATSILPILNRKKLLQYIKENETCNRLLEQRLTMCGVPVIQSSEDRPKTLHTWIMCETQEKNYEYYLKLEQLGLLTNYRLLPYNLGHGLRIGFGAAVRSGFCSRHVPALADIMAEAYHSKVTSTLQKKASKLIKRVKMTIVEPLDKI